MKPVAIALTRIIEGHFKGPIAADRRESARHLRFAMGHLAIGLIGSAMFPLWLSIGAPGGGLAAVGVALSVAPLAIVAMVLHTGRLDLGLGLSFASAAAFVLWLCLVSGGVTSPALLLFSVVPLAARTGDNTVRRVALITALAGLALTVSIGLIGSTGGLGQPAMLGVAIATAAILAASLWPRSRPEDSSERLTTPAGRADEPYPIPALTSRSDPGIAAAGHSPDTIRAIESIVGLAALLRTATAAQEPPAEWQAYATLIRNAGEGLQRAVAGEAVVEAAQPEAMRSVGDVVTLCWQAANGPPEASALVLSLEADSALQMSSLMAARLGPVLIDILTRIKGEAHGSVAVRVARDSSGKRIEIEMNASIRSDSGPLPFLQRGPSYNPVADMADSAIRRRVSEIGGTAFAERRDDGRAKIVLRLPIVEAEMANARPIDGVRRSA